MSSRGVNRVTLVGFLGRDPDFRHTRNGTAVCNISIATTDSWVREGKKMEKTTWHKVVCWEGLAEIAVKYLKKGRQVYIEGKLQTREWKDKSGADRFTTEIYAEQLQMMGGRGEEEIKFKEP
jgi:single-strand DNA-binding protein